MANATIPVKTMSLPSLLLRLEGLALFAGAIVLYAQLGGDWLPFVLLLLTPDLSMLGFLAGPRVGARIYNAAHTYAVPVALALLALAANAPVLLQVALIWSAHISMDRALGYGLKYPAGFKDTHLGRV